MSPPYFLTKQPITQPATTELSTKNLWKKKPKKGKATIAKKVYEYDKTTPIHSPFAANRLPSITHESMTYLMKQKTLPDVVALDYRISHIPKSKSSTSERKRLFAIIAANASHAVTHKERLRFRRIDLKRSLLGINTKEVCLPPLHIFFKHFQSNQDVASLVTCQQPVSLPIQAPNSIDSLPHNIPDTCIQYLKSPIIPPLPTPSLQIKSKFDRFIKGYKDIYSWFMTETTKTVMTRDNFMNHKVPIFFNGNPKIAEIPGVPNPSITYPVTKLTIVDTCHGFRFPLEDKGVDDVLLLPRRFIMDSQPNQELLLNALESAERKTHATLTRGTKRIIAYQTKGAKYITPGIYPKRNGTGLEMKTLHHLKSHEWNRIFKYINYCETKAVGYMSSRIIKGIEIARKFVPFPTFPSPDGKTETKFTASFAAARDVCLNCHTDEDSMYGIVSPIDANKSDRFRWESDICCYFSFPEFGFAVALRPGDILLFNPTTYHCISSRANPDQHIWCTTLYLKNAVVGGNNNSLPLSSAQTKVQQLFSNNK